MPFVVLLIALVSPAISAAAEKAPMLGVGHFQIPDWFKASFLDLSEDVSEAAGQGRRLMLVFHQDGCPYCAKLVNQNFAQKGIVDFTREHFDVVELNLWGARAVADFEGSPLSEAELGKKLKVWFTPTVLFLDEAGRVVFRMNGYYSPAKFLTALRYVAEKRETVEPFAEFARREMSPADKGEIVPIAPFAAGDIDLRGDGPKVVLFEQTDCPECEALHRGALAEAETRVLLKDLDAFQLDRWSGTPVTTPDGRQTTARAFADELKLSYLPALVIFDEGSEVIRAEALFKTFHIQSMITYATSDAYKTETEFQRYIHARSDEMRDRGITVNLWD